MRKRRGLAFGVAVMAGVLVSHTAAAQVPSWNSYGLSDAFAEDPDRLARGRDACSGRSSVITSRHQQRSSLRSPPQPKERAE